MSADRTAGRDDTTPPDSGGGPGVAPTDIGDDVRADLEAAFERDATRLRIKDDPTVDSGALNVGGDTTGLSVPDRSASSTDVAEVSERDGDRETPGRRSRRSRRRRRRSILEIARDYDTRIKAQTELKSTPVVADTGGESTATEDVDSASIIANTESDDDQMESPSAKSAAVSPAVKVAPDGKKRVVITDDTVDAARTAGDRPRPSRRRFGFRIRSAEDDELSRLRKQRRAKQRAEGRWRPRWYVVVGSIGLVVVLVLLVLTSPILSIKQVQLEGNVYADPELLNAVIADLEGDPILTADLHGAQMRVEDIPWVRKARVSMHLPSKVVIQVDERVPLAFVRSTDGFNRVIDRDGRILDVIEGDPIEYVRIIGTAPTLVAGEFVPQPFLGAAQLINALPVDLAARLVSATVSPEGEISLQFTPNLQVIFGAPADYQAKLVGVINEIKRQGTRSYTVIDVSTGEPNVR